MTGKKDCECQFIKAGRALFGNSGFSSRTMISLKEFYVRKETVEFEYLLLSHYFREDEFKDDEISVRGTN